MDNGASSYRRFLDGDEQAFDQIMEAYKSNLIFFIDRYVNNMTVAEDIAIDAFTELLVHRHRYNFKVGLKTYLFMIGRSRALNYIKHRDKFRMVEIADAEPELVYRENLEEQMMASERKQIVHRAMEQIPEDMREVLHLIYFEELTYEEAAKVMKKNRKQIDNLLYRAKGTLRTILGEEGKELI